MPLHIIGPAWAIMSVGVGVDNLLCPFTYNHGNDIVGLFVLPNFPLTTSETERVY